MVSRHRLTVATAALAAALLALPAARRVRRSTRHRRGQPHLHTTRRHPSHLNRLTRSMRSRDEEHRPRLG
jgi:hypothetical protein